MRDKALRDAREEKEELEALHRLDEECVHQQRAGNYLKAFDCMERALVLRRHFFGIDSEEVIQACRALAEMCNLLAMSFLQQDNYAVTIDLLKKAEVLTQRHHPAERATTLNNLACYYRRLGKLHSAMTSLKRALELEKRLENVRNAADTQLNMCAVLSQLGKHQEALEHAQEALIALQEGFIQGKHTTDSAAADNATGDPSSVRLDRISVMCIAYHNVGVEQEFLKNFAESVLSYKKVRRLVQMWFTNIASLTTCCVFSHGIEQGVSLAEQYLGADHSITTTIRNSYLAAKRTMATKARVRPCSASRDQKSPGKAGARFLLSPRTGSLRMPSPLAKEKDRHNGSQIPTPRSIIADALSRAPLSALPPLEIQSPKSAGKKKKKKVDASETKSAAAPLSPTDPFFSPRFRFAHDAPESKPKKLASITSPRPVTATAEVQTPPSSKGKRERRKSSVKKPPTTPQAADTAADERMKTPPTARSSEEPQSDVIPIEDSPVLDVPVMETEAEEINTSLQTPMSAEAIAEKIGSPRLSDTQSDSSCNEQHSGEGVLKDHGESEAQEREINENFALPGAESVETAVSVVLTSLVEHVANALLVTVVMAEGDSDGEEPRDVQQSSDARDVEQPTDSLSLDGVAELRTDSESHNGHDTVDSSGVDQDNNLSNINDCEIPAAETVEDALGVSGPTQEEEHTTDNEPAYTEELGQTIADEAAEISLVTSNESVTEGRANAESSYEHFQGKDDPAEDIAPHYENTESVEANEAPPDAELEDATENSEVTLTREAELTEGQVLMEAATYCETPSNETPTFEVPDEIALAASDSSELPTVASDDLGDEAGDHQVMVSSAEEDTNGPSDETQEDYNADDSGESIYYDEGNYASTEDAALDVDPSDNTFEDAAHQGEEDVEDGHPFEQEFGFQNEQFAVDYEQSSREDAGASDEVQQDWSHEEQLEPVAAVETVPECGESYQEPPEAFAEEQQPYDDNAAAFESVDQPPHGGESAEVHVEPLDPNDGDVAIE